MVSIHGREFEVEDEPADYWKWIQEGRYDHEWQVYNRHLKPEHNFVDLGAWVGAHSLYAGKVAASVLAVEPDPVAFDILKKNIRAESGNYEIAKLAVSDRLGYAILGSGFLGASTTRENPNAGRGIGPWEDGQTFSAACMTIYALTHHIPDPLFIKMDIEGMEEKVLRDREFFKARRPILYLELHPFWWKDGGKTLRDLDQVCQLYKTVEQVTSESYLLA